MCCILQGVFFPNGIGGAITKPGDFNGSTSALQDWPANAALATQVRSLLRSSFKFQVPQRSALLLWISLSGDCKAA